MITEQDKTHLLEIARTTITTHIQGRPVTGPNQWESTPVLAAKYGVFVTLKKKGELRGCIGCVEPVKPLLDSVIELSVSAACHDHRFNPVSEEEIADILIEITVLSPPQKVASYHEIVVGQHGIILEKQNKRALFLPQVATEYGWTLSTTLSHLAQKAGLAPLDWQQDTLFWVFEGIKFQENMT